MIFTDHIYTHCNIKFNIVVYWTLQVPKKLVSFKYAQITALHAEYLTFQGQLFF